LVNHFRTMFALRIYSSSSFALSGMYAILANSCPLKYLNPLLGH